MKLRVHGDSIRLRLSPQDIAHLVNNGQVRMETAFGPESLLTYSIIAGKTVTQIAAAFKNGSIQIDLPLQIAKRWASSDQVSIATEQDCGNRRSLAILIEKDFDCLHKPNEGEEKLFPNPKDADGKQ